MPAHWAHFAAVQPPPPPLLEDELELDDGVVDVDDVLLDGGKVVGVAASFRLHPLFATSSAGQVTFWNVMLGLSAPLNQSKRQ